MKPVDYELCQHAEQIQALIVSWFVCWQDYTKKTTLPIFTKFGGKVELGPRKKPLGSGSNPDRVTYSVRVMVTVSDVV